MARMVYYVALNGTRKVLDLGKMLKIPGSEDRFQVYVSRHCGGLLAVRMTPNGGVEITEQALRERLAEVGAKLPWEE